MHALVEQLTGDNARLRREADDLALTVSRLEMAGAGGEGGGRTYRVKVGEVCEKCESSV